MENHSRSLAQISTQYARNGPLLEEAREYVQLVARGVERSERRRLLVVENGLRRQTFKARRNLFEALEGRFADKQRAHDLGLLVVANASARAFALGALMELARHDGLIKEFMAFLVSRIGMPRSATDSRIFLHELGVRDIAIEKWSATLRRRAESALNALPRKFDIWAASADPVIAPIELPPELGALIIQERVTAGLSPMGAPEFAMLGISRDAIVELLWACARRNWFYVDIVGNIVHVERKFESVESLLGTNIKRVFA